MFYLTKWYCDCVSDDGDAFIGYWARMRWGPVAIAYAATLYKPAGDATRERYSIRRCAAPVLTEDELLWDCERLGLRGMWKLQAPAVECRLLDTAEGAITWRCHVPSARVRIELAGLGRISGLGYAERLDLSIKPWRLPFDELHWGRFLSPEDAVIWIEWRGEESRRWIFHNDTELPGSSLQAGRVELEGGQGIVELEDGAVIREGRLASTATGGLPAAALWLPGRIRRAHETKRLSRGSLTSGTRSSTGWAIHEIVRLR
jgi:hypothetical protein